MPSMPEQRRGPPWVATLTPIRWAAILFALTGLFGVTGVLATVIHLARYREHPLVVGIRGLAGPFDALGIDAVVVLGGLFVALSAIELLIAQLLWRSRKLGGVLALLLFPASLLLWVGFAVPFWLVAGPVRMVLLGRGWRTLR